MTFPSPKPWPRTGTSTVAQQRLYAQQHGIKILDKDVLSKARGQPTAEERKAKRIEEAIAHKRYLGLDPSEAETGVETEANVMPRPPHPYITVASYTGNKTGGKGRCVIFKRVHQYPNLSAASVATAPGTKEAEVGDGTLFNCPHEDFGKSSETSVENTKPETDS
uniref:uncharacterized protein LOC122596378 isoform X1 n=1 Tax=Erigeron canadensis TaxID=72917 RepID=UPI001CB91F0F|nr:uncharacterized protein LOC122596378 isoform X1 [Erigeron canadensis]